MKSLTDNLTFLLTQRTQSLNDRDRHAQMIDALAAEEADLLPKLEVSNEADFKKLSDIRLRREIVPRKVAQFEEQTAAIEAKIKTECQRVAGELSRQLSLRKAAGRGQITRAVAAFVAEPIALEQCVAHVASRAEPFQQLVSWEFLCSNTISVTSYDPVLRATELMALAKHLATQA